MNTRERIELIAHACHGVTPWLGPINTGQLFEWVAEELGHGDALDRWVPHGDIQSRAVPRDPVLHIVSGNTPHAAFQSILRGLIVGGNHRIKLPSTGLPEVETWLASLPTTLRSQWEVRNDVPKEWLTTSRTVVAFGSDETMAEIHSQLSPETRFLPHGHKLSIALVWQAGDGTPQLAARDICRFLQQGCLSVHAVYVSGGSAAAKSFARDLAAAMSQWEQQEPRGPIPLSVSGALQHARDLARFRAAQGEDIEIYSSADSTAWTVVFENTPLLQPSPLFRFVRVQPMPENLTSQALGPEARFLSTVVMHPFDERHAERALDLGARRFAPLGKGQEPSLFWHHDGMPTLASMVDWIDLG